MNWKYIGLSFECLPVRQTGNSIKNLNWTEDGSQKTEENTQ